MAVAGLVLGILSVLGSIVPVAGLVFGILSTVFGGVSMGRDGVGALNAAAMAAGIAGICTCLVVTLETVLVISQATNAPSLGAFWADVIRATGLLG